MISMLYLKPIQTSTEPILKNNVSLLSLINTSPNWRSSLSSQWDVHQTPSFASRTVLGCSMTSQP
eukprot:1241466-Amphidinium_carterae.1